MVIKQVIRSARIVHQVRKQLANASLSLKNIRSCNDGCKKENQKQRERKIW